MSTKKNTQARQESEYSKPKQSNSRPYIITLKNTTDEKLYNVDVINYEHEKQDKIKYECPIGNVTYNDILRACASENAPIQKIGRIMIIPFCDYEKFKKKQFCCGIRIGEKDSNGNSFEKLFESMLDPYQTREDCVVINHEFYFYNKPIIKIPFLMPETEVIFRLYPIILTK